MPITSPLGYVDLAQLLKDECGRVTFELFDSGTFRRGRGRFSYSLVEKNKLVIHVLDQGGRATSEITIRNPIPLTPATVKFLGLYLGDGTKAARPGTRGIISFSQREPHLANFVRRQFIQVFGESISFTHRVNEDALFFMTDDMRQALTNLRHKLLKEGQGVMTDAHLAKYLKRDLNEVIAEQSGSTRRAVQKHAQKPSLAEYRRYLVEFFANRSVMNEYLRRKKLQELEASGTPLGPNDRIAVNVRLPGVKGSREEGKSSRSDELDVGGLSPFRPIFLRMLEDVLHSIEQNQPQVFVKGSSKPWIVWYGLPHTFAECSISTETYVKEAESTCYVTSRGNTKRYIVHRLDGKLRLSKSKSRNAFEIPETLTLTPLICAFIGLYLAEGNTAKFKVFQFFKEPTTGLALGYTASEETSMNICINAMKKLFIGKQGEVDYWRIKVGSKYFAETVTIGNKIGSPILRRGPSGQGAASGFEVVEVLKKWALATIPSLVQFEERFDHVEYTGAGIPRVDIFYSNTASVYLFAIMRDMIEAPENLERFSVGRKLRA